MIRNFNWLWVLVVCLFVVSHSIAAEKGQTSSGQKDESSTLGFQKASDVVKAKVQNSRGENLGQINDLIIMPDGKVGYAILSHGGVLGIGNKLIPIPWQALKPGPDWNIFTVNIDKAELEKAPNFDPKEWPSFVEPEWQKKVEVFYRLPPGESGNR